MLVRTTQLSRDPETELKSIEGVRSDSPHLPPQAVLRDKHFQVGPLSF